MNLEKLTKEELIEYIRALERDKNLFLTPVSAGVLLWLESEGTEEAGDEL